MEEKYFRVASAGIGSFYHDMVGKLAFETDKTYLLEFRLNGRLGGTHRVMFPKYQLEEYDMS